MTDIDKCVAYKHIESASATCWRRLGYRRAYLYDTPFEGDRVWLDLHGLPSCLDDQVGPPSWFRRNATVGPPRNRVTASTGPGRIGLLRHRSAAPPSPPSVVVHEVSVPTGHW
jgi:hypothetical protein